MITKPSRNENTWMRYLGMSGQFLAAITLAILLGSWLDRKISGQIPWCSIALPVLVVVGMLTQVYKNTRMPKKRINKKY